ncbi:PRC-barrel domain-containing protein [Azospirillum sp. ST 5-10]|uniref:PRC-barrel domain-containing protein n=1 Tax=unclassified Azospirillum TaxID=2630922 RepID=UPI003F4A0AF9
MRRELITAVSVLALMSGVAYAQSVEPNAAADSTAQPQIMDTQSDTNMKADDSATGAMSDDAADVEVKTDDSTAAGDTGLKTDDDTAADTSSDVTAPADSPAATMTPPAGSTDTPAVTTTGDSAASAGVDMASAEKMLGADVIGSDGEDLGEVEDVILDDSGKAKQLVISSGGFLGIGEKEVAVDFSTATWNEAEEQVQLSGITQDQIKEMTDFEYSDTTTSLNRRMEEREQTAPAAPGATGAMPPASGQ